jgi:hypothetical protein
MKTQSVRAQDARINIRVDGDLKREAENAFTKAVKSVILRKQANGLPVARFDRDGQRPYLEYPDGRRDYTLEG